MNKILLLGNEAIAHGARDAGVKVLSAYPGTPSTEIAETMANFKDVNAQWAANEKVAAEVALGACVAGVRAMCAMKHVGLNVASEVLFTGAYTGVNAGLVFVVADDPGMHSSQNEQDTRLIAAAAHVPVLEPADCQQAYDFMFLAFELSESMDIPVIVRLTTRIAHARGFVTKRERVQVETKSYVKQAQKYVMVPQNAVVRRKSLLEREALLRLYAETTPVNRIERGSSRIGVITSGICIQYVREALPEASVFCLGMVNPLPRTAIEAFAGSVDTLYVVEELEGFIQTQVRSWGIACTGSEIFGLAGELSVFAIRRAVCGGENKSTAQPDLPARPPVLCAGCPHRAAFNVLRRLRATVFGDIGCYTLGAAPPLSSMDTTVCMGASIGMAHGAELALGREFAGKSVAVIGDSTFFHSGMTGLASAAYNGSNITVLILDNGITGMTGHQDNPSTGKTLGGRETVKLGIEDICRALGASIVTVVDPVDQKALTKALRDAWAADGVKVIIARRPCALLVKVDGVLTIDQSLCIGCKLCMQTGCPALRFADGKASIDASMCRGCGLCREVCPSGCIGMEGLRI